MQMQEVIKYKVEEEVEEILAQKIPEIIASTTASVAASTAASTEHQLMAQLSRLIDALSADNRLDDIKRVADDAEFRKELLEHYGLI